jgi:hypothetical protein
MRENPFFRENDRQGIEYLVVFILISAICFGKKPIGHCNALLFSENWSPSASDHRVA